MPSHRSRHLTVPGGLVSPSSKERAETFQGKSLTPREAKKLGLMKTGEAARFLETTTRTLLFYEEEGLLRPRRTARGTRLYSRFDLTRAEVAIRLSRLGFPLRLLKQLALTRLAAETGRESSQRLAELFNDTRRELNARVDALQELGEDIERADGLVRQCRACPNRPARRTCPHCPCELNLGRSKILHLTWDGDP